MKKILCRVLALALVVMSIMTVAASAEGKFVLPDYVDKMAKQLPEREVPATIRTKTIDGEIHVYVSEEVDSLTAQWLGYKEAKEVVDLEDQKALIDIEGHTYQLGARYTTGRWNKKTHTFIGTESKGQPNQAYVLVKGPWTGIYTRAGKLTQLTKKEENTDYFQLGLAGSTGTVRWNFRNGYQAGQVWFVSQVEEKYAEGDIAAITAQFDQRGKLRHYYVTYRTGEDETYQIRYNNHDEAQQGNYTGKDADGETIRAYTASKTQWADSKTHKLATCVELNWNLKKFSDSLFQNPPRAKK